MKAAQVTVATSDFSDVKIVSVAKPTPASDQVLIKQKYSSVNPIDWKVIGGHLVGAGWSLPFPFTLGYDFAGIVEEVGLNVNDFKVGDEVFGVNWGKSKHDEENQPLAGAFAEYILVPASKVSIKPSGLPFAEAAALALVGTTSFQALFYCAQVGNGSRVLILGGATATGSVGIQLAKSKGAYVITTCSTRAKSYVESFHADQVIDYTSENWDTLKDLDAVYDTVGQEGTFEKAKRVLKSNGAFVSIAGFEAGFNPAGHAPLSFASFFCLSNEAKVQDNLAKLYVDGKIKIAIDETFEFTEDSVRKLLDKQLSGKSLGKNVIKF